MGDSLITSEITKLLRKEPDFSQTKGEKIIGQKTGKIRIAQLGIWGINAIEQQPEDINAQVQEIFEGLTEDLSVWADIASRFQIDLFCGLFMNAANEGASLSPETMVFLGQRGVELDLDIYGPVNEE